MRNFMKKSFAFGLGLAVTSKEQIERTVDELVKKGEIAPEESKRMINQMMERGEEERKNLTKMIRDQVYHMLKDLDVATKEEVTDIKTRLEDLEKKVDQLEQKTEHINKE